jgi:GT2 family glycosyltransferase
MFKLAAVIPTFNRKDSLLRVLELLKNQSLQNIALSIIAVVDGSSDGTREALHSLHPEVSIIDGDSNWWWTKSVNEGCKLALDNNADAVLLLNDDIEIPPDYLHHLVQAAGKEPADVIGSLNITGEEKRIYFSGVNKIQWWNGKLKRYHDFLSPLKKRLGGLYKSVVLPGRGTLIPAEVFAQIGFFDEKALPQYKADYDFVLRAHEHKIKTLICWDAVIYVQVADTGKGATFIRQSLLGFVSSFFKKNSRTNIFHNFSYYIRHYPRWGLPLIPLSLLMVTMRQFFMFMKSEKY